MKKRGAAAEGSAVMGFGERMQACREALGLSRQELALLLGVSPSAVSNYEKNISFPKEEVLLRLFDALGTDPNTLFQDSFRQGGQVLSRSERQLLEAYRGLSPKGRETVRSVVDTLCAYRDEVEAGREEQEPRLISLYRSPAAAGYAAPVFGEESRLFGGHRGGACGGPVRRPHPGGFHGPLYRRRLRGLCEPRPIEGGRCGDLLCGRGDVLQAVL